MERQSDFFFPLMCQSIPEYFRLKSEKELGETPEKVKHGLEILRKFLQKEGYPPNRDDTFLLQFLRQQKFNVHKAETKLKEYYIMREKASSLFQSMDAQTFRAMLDSKMLGMLPFRDMKGRAIFFTIGGELLDRFSFSPHELFKCAIALAHFAHTFPLTSICGINVLGDSTTRITQCLPIFAEGRKFLWIERSCPFRIQRIDYYNEPPFIYYMWKGISVFFPAKYIKRMFFHGPGTASINTIYDPSILRKELGGTLEASESDSYIEPFLEYVQKLKSENYLYRKQL